MGRSGSDDPAGLPALHERLHRPGLALAQPAVRLQLGQLATIVGWANLAYHDNGMLSQVQHVNGVIDTIEKDPHQMARPYNIRVATPGGEAQLGVHSYDAGGNLFRLRPDPGTLTFQQLDPGAPAVQSPQTADTYFLYDTLGRIKLHHDQAGFQQAYDYDKLGNATQIGSVAYPVDKSTNRLSMNATYDHRGNITSRLNGTGTELYRWDLIDQLAARNFPSETHLYTVDGERVWTLQQSPAGLKETFTLRDLGGKVLSVFDKASEVTTWKHDYIHRGSLQLGKATPAATPKDKVHFTLDHLGSTRVVTLDNGKTLETHHFFAYGEEFAGARASDEKLLFTGHERDKNGMGTVDDLDYMHARYYGPQLGRFLSVDPVLNVKRALRKPQNWNRYTYVAGNPMRFVDPTGMTLELTGDADQRRKALQDLRSTVPYELRSFVRTTTTKDGRTIIDARYLNMMRGASSQNFQALRQIANSPGLALFNSSATVSISKLGTEGLGSNGDSYGITYTTQQSNSGNVEIYSGGDLDALEAAKTTAHELRHARRFLLGLPGLHEIATTFVELPNGVSVEYALDPQGPVTLETQAAMDEAEANQ
jgi:RHS repeat-associated protein